MSSNHEKYRSSPRSRNRRLTAIGFTALIGFGAIAVTGIVTRTTSEAKLEQWTEEQAIPTVEVVTPKRGAENQELVLPGSIDAFFEAPIYARVNGYLKTWYQDIGAHVKAGQLLAVIDAPDLDQELQQAEADLAQAKANEELAAVTAQRWEALVASNSVSRQATDEKIGDLNAKKAALEAANANVKRLRAMEAFKRIVAPFDGVVTARKTDVGALINAGSGTGRELELFAVADIHKMRVYVRAPQAMTNGLTVGMKAELHLPEMPNKVFPATLTTTAQSITDASRTMLVELEADNPKGLLRPGTCAEVHFKLPDNPNVLRVPTAALLFREEGLRLAVVGPDNKVILKRVQVGRDSGTEIEVLTGLSPNDRVINSPPDSIEQGDTVRIATAQGEGAPREAGEIKLGANQ